MSLTEPQVEYVDTSDLEPHQLNREIYTNRDITNLVEKIDEHGFQDEHELLVTPDNKILSGHRRWRSALELGISEVPVRRKDVEGDDALLTLLLANQYRDKTPAEKIREGQAWESIEREKAKERQSHGQTAPGKNASGNSTTSEEPTRQKVGDKIGVSGKTYDKGKQIKEQADSGDETAQEQWEQLETGEQSIHGAYTEVKKAQNRDKTEEPPESVVESSWRNADVTETQVQYRQTDTDGAYEIHVDGDDYEITEDLLMALLE